MADENSPCIEVLNYHPLPVSSLKFGGLYEPKIKYFNGIQAQVLDALYNTDDNIFVGAPNGSGKTLCSEFSILRMLNNDPVHGKCIYVTPKSDLAHLVYSEWVGRFRSLDGTVSLLTGDLAEDLDLISEGNIAIATAEVWDKFSRRLSDAKVYDVMRSTRLFICDDLHLIGENEGSLLEVVVSRMKSISDMIGNIRIVAMSSSISNIKDIQQWLDFTPTSVFNFHPKVRPVRLNIQVLGFDVTHDPSQIMSMTNVVYSTIKLLSPNKPVIIFVPSRRQAMVTACDLLSLYVEDFQETRLLQTQNTPEFLVGYLHEGLCEADRHMVTKSFEEGSIQVLIVSRDLAWSLRVEARLAIVMGTQFYNGKIQAYEDYPITDILKMIGRANRPLLNEEANAVILCQSSKIDYYKKFLQEPLPVESRLDRSLHDHVNAEIVNRTIQNKSEADVYILWTFLNERMTRNPNYYGLQGVSHEDIRNHLLEMIRSTLNDLERAEFIGVGVEGDVSPRFLGICARNYYISCTTMELFSSSLNSDMDESGLINIISKATEFENITIRPHEDILLKELAGNLSIDFQNPDLRNPNFKTRLILQAHIARSQLTPELAADKGEVLSKVFGLIYACTEVLSSKGLLHLTLAAMKLAQRVSQAMLEKDRYLENLPNFYNESMRKLERLRSTLYDMNLIWNKENVDSLSKIIKKEMLQSTEKNVTYAVDFSCEVLRQGSQVTVSIFVKSYHFVMMDRERGWWVVIGETESGKVLAFKQFTLQQKDVIRLNLELTGSANRNIVLYLRSDSDVQYDREYDLSINDSEV